MDSTSRRYFLKRTLLTGSVLPFCTHRSMWRNGTQDCEKELQELYLRLQKRQIHERAVLFKKLIKQYGTGILDIVQRNSIEETRKTLQNADLPQRNLDTILEILWEPAEDVLDFEIVEQSPQHLKMKVTWCLFAEEMLKEDAADIGFAFYCAYDYGFCEGLNPDIQFTRTKTLLTGYDHCNHAYVL